MISTGRCFLVMMTKKSVISKKMNKRIVGTRRTQLPIIPQLFRGLSALQVCTVGNQFRKNFVLDYEPLVAINQNKD